MTEKIISPNASAVITSTHFCVPDRLACGCAVAASPAAAASFVAPGSSQPTSEAPGSLRTFAA